MLQLFKILQLIWQLVLFKMLQLQGANPMTPIEVKSQQLIIFKNASASGASPLTPFVVKSHIFSLKCFQLLIWQPVISKLLQLQGASPLTPIEVTSHIFNAEIDVILKSPWPLWGNISQVYCWNCLSDKLVILKMLQLQGASPLTPFKFRYAYHLQWFQIYAYAY